MDAETLSFVQLQTLLKDALALAGGAATPAVERLKEAAAPIFSPHWRVLISGLCSVGKSSFVSALWGDSRILPTAVRDCTQTNTLLRVPRAGEEHPRILLSFLPRAQALEYTTRDLSYYRLLEFLAGATGPVAARLEELPPEERLKEIVRTVRKLFRERQDLLVLNEPLTEELEKLEQFLEFIDSPAYQPGEILPANWADRREHLMGHRRPDGRTLDVGKLLALRHVELIRPSDGWRRWSAPGSSAAPPGHQPPQIIDTPWIPTFRNARRADLIMVQARQTDLLVILALPQALQLEPWVLEIFRERPELPARTLVVFNQLDTVDTAALFSREGFAAEFEENAARLAKLGIPPDNLFMSCARLPFLENCPPGEMTRLPLESTKRELLRLRNCAAGRPASSFTRKLACVCDPADAGIESVRARLVELARGLVGRNHRKQALTALEALGPLDVAQRHGSWQAILARAADLKR
jgi:hypothetical protein